MGFFALATAAPIPPNKFISGYPTVGHDSCYLVFHRSPIHSRERQTDLFFYAGKDLLLYGLSNRQITIHWPVLFVAHPVGDKTDLSPLLTRVLQLALNYS